MLLTMFAKLPHFEPILQNFFILVAEIVDAFAHRAFHFNHVVLGHTIEIFNLQFLIFNDCSINEN